MNLKQKSIKGLIWDFTGRVGLQGVGFLVSIIMARILAPEDFGLLAIIMVIISLASVFLDFGFSTALIQRSEINEFHYASVFYLNVIMGFLLATLVFFLAPFIAAFYENDLLKNLIRFMSLSFIINSFGNVTRAHLHRQMNFKLISLSNIIAALLSGVLAVYMVMTGYGIWSLAVQNIVNQLIANIILYVFASFRHTLKLRLQSIKELWSFSSKMFFSGLIDTLFLNVDSLIIGKLLNPATLGYYYRAKSLENFSFRYTASAITSVLLPGLSSLQNDTARLKHVVLKSFHLLSFISFLGCGLLLVTGHEIIILIFSDKWEPSVVFFQIIIAGAFASQIFAIFYNTLLSTGNISKYLLINVVYKLLLFFNFIFLFIWGINTYLVIFTLIQITIFFLGMIAVTRLLNFEKILYMETSKYLFIYFLSISTIFFIKHTLPFSNLFNTFVVVSVLFCLFYFILSHLVKVQGLILFKNELIKPVITKLSRKNS